MNKMVSGGLRTLQGNHVVNGRTGSPPTKEETVTGQQRWAAAREDPTTRSQLLAEAGQQSRPRVGPGLWVINHLLL